MQGIRNTFHYLIGSPKEEVKRPPKFHQRLKYFLQEYFVNIQVDGLFYLSEDRSVFEKIFWGFSFLISLSVGIYMFILICQKFENSPVLVTFGTKETPIFTIPFPALTICNEDKTSHEFNYTFAKELFEANASAVNATTMEKLQYLQYGCDRDKNISGPNYYRQDFYDIIDKLSPQFKMSFVDCFFMRQRFKSCAEIFVPTITDNGICYSFNMLPRKEIFKDDVNFPAKYFATDASTKDVWDVTTGYTTSKREVYPRRALSAGTSDSLYVTLVTYEQNGHGLCKKHSSQGFRAVVHSPLDAPRLSSNYFRIPLDSHVGAMVAPSVEITSKTVAQFKPTKRKCFFQNEKYLRYFKTYSKANCVLECYTNWTHKECGCAEFYMPRDHSTPICGVGKLDCTATARELMREMEISGRFTSNEFQHCGCMPLCNRLKYTHSSSYASFSNNHYIKAKSAVHHFLNQSGVHVTVIHVYMKADQFLAVERQEMFGVWDLIASFGGLLSLFTGISFLSFAEFIYYCTIRLFFNYRLYGRFEGSYDGSF